MASTRSFLFGVLLACPSGGVGSAQDVGSDQQGPRILNLDLTGDGDGRVLVRWRTDEPARWSLRYGDAFPLIHRRSSDAFARKHHVLIENLRPGDRVNFVVSPEDVLGNVGEPFNGGFDPGDVPVDTTPPTVQNVRISAGPGEQAFVVWLADEPVTSLFEYGLSPAYGDSVQTTFLSELQATVLGGLAPASRYHYRLTVTDAFGNTSTTPDENFVQAGFAGEEITGTRLAWHPLTISFPGPTHTERDESPNPFLDYRMGALFTGPSGQTYLVPGYFDGDGAGGGTGNVWRLRFTPDEEGRWTYLTRFVTGDEIAVSLDLTAGTPLAFNNTTGYVDVGPRDPDAPGFHRHGRLEYVGEHYLKFRDGPYFIKTGTDSPENLLGYAGFDNTFDQGGHANGLINGTHLYPQHVADFGPGGLGDEDDPFFVSADTGIGSQGLVGAINYLSSMGVNSVYFLPMNLGGDGQETYPFQGATNDPFNDTHYDISKLWQWSQVLDHATRRGLLLHFVLGEVELPNRTWLDNGTLGVERKLFYREMVARFSHSLAIKWNLSEENAFSIADTVAFASFLQGIDPYNHPIGFHTLTLPSDSSSPLFSAVLGDPRFSINSIQSNITDAGDHVEYWRQQSAAAGRKWVVEVDEITTGLTDQNAIQHRRRALYDVLFGGGNIEFYFGGFQLPLGGDLDAEDFRTREEMWGYARAAREFLEQNLPFWEMMPEDDLVQGETPHSDGSGAEVFAKVGECYAIFYPTAVGTGMLDLSDAPGIYTKRWWRPGAGQFEGGTETLVGGSVVPVGSPPFNEGTDWVCLVERQ